MTVWLGTQVLGIYNEQYFVAYLKEVLVLNGSLCQTEISGFFQLFTDRFEYIYSAITLRNITLVSMTVIQWESSIKFFDMRK
jgi:hypothetical protein